MEDANDLDGVEGEVHLARLTLEIYEVMVDYCRYMHASFSEMLKNTDEKDLDEDDKLLAEWIGDQVSTLEKIFDHDQMRKNIIEKIMTEVLAQSASKEIIH